ncbi:O-antigen ligase family protein [Roseimaritima sediminicola]|uniref:O-antigen ligase family protein n=1 Tax=Roseimaritima sediminicola TaxID=2662066 RepID=UPI0012984A42|nr:O-antigen ligase family protein [Roseimaritima sediminicola]
MFSATRGKHQPVPMRPLAPSPGRDPWITTGHRCMDLSLLAVLFLAPLVLGGRHPHGRLVLMVAVLLGSIGVVVKVVAGGRLRLTVWTLAAMLFCLAIPLLQIVPVGPGWVEHAAPGIEKLFAEDVPLVSTSQLHNSFSLSILTTRRALPILVTYLCLLVIVVCRLESIKDIERVLLWLVATALTLASVALLQASWGNGLFLWLYDHPSRQPGTIPRGPFQNENHLSSLLASILPAVLYFLFRVPKAASPGGGPGVNREDRQSSDHQRSDHQHFRARRFRGLAAGDWQRLVAAIACVIVICTVFATPSRGGAVVIAFSALLWFALALWRWIGVRYLRDFSLQLWMRIGVGGCVGLLVVAAAALFTEVHRLSYWRAKIWSVDYAIWQDFPLLGIGVGNHRHVYRAYLDEYFPQTFSTGESSWLQLLVETGSVGVSLALLIVVATLVHTTQAFSNPTARWSPLLGCAVLAGLIASCAHAIGDFPWHIPACFVVVLVLAAIAIRLPVLVKVEQAGHSDSACSSPVRRPLFAGSLLLAIGLLAGNAWSIVQAVPQSQAAWAWDDYRRLVRDREAGEESADGSAEIALLQETLRYDPGHILARIKLTHRLTAELERQAFQMQDPKPLAEHVLSQAATLAAICPSESRSYLYAATASARLGGAVELQQRMLAQSQRLRMVDGRVALRMGLNAIMLQDQVQADRQFKIALEADPSCREHVVQTLAMLYSPEEILRRWNPTREPAALLFALVDTPAQSQESRQIVGRHYCNQLVVDASRAPSLEEQGHLLAAAFRIAQRIDDQDLMLDVVNRRIALRPRRVPLLLTRANLLLQLGEVVNARKDLETCRQISPRDEQVRQLAYLIDQAKVRRLR